MPISDEVKQAIRERAKYICEYCHSPERLSANWFTIDHVIPKSLGGSDRIDNLAFAYWRCNEKRHNMCKRKSLRFFRSKLIYKAFRHYET